MNTGDRNIQGRIIYRGPKGGLYVLTKGGKKAYKFTRPLEQNVALPNRGVHLRGLPNLQPRRLNFNALNNLNRRLQAVNLQPRRLNFNAANLNLQPRMLNFNALNNLNRRLHAVNLQPRRLNFNNENTIFGRTGSRNNILSNTGVYVNKYVLGVVKILQEFGANRPANIMLKLDLYHTTLPEITTGNAKNLQNAITRQIAMCHLDTEVQGKSIIETNIIKTNYLKRMRNQMVQVCKDILEKIKKRKLTKENFASEFDALYASRPCIENLIQALSDVAYGEIGWTGKNAKKLLILDENNRTTNNARAILRNQVLGTYLNPLFRGMTKPQQIKFNKQRLWNSVKNKNVYMINPVIDNVPIYAKLSMIKNARNVSNETYNTYANYLNVPDKYKVLANAIKKYKQVRRR